MFGYPGRCGRKKGDRLRGTDFRPDFIAPPDGRKRFTIPAPAQDDERSEAGQLPLPGLEGTHRVNPQARIRPGPLQWGCSPLGYFFLATVLTAVGCAAALSLAASARSFTALSASALATATLASATLTAAARVFSTIPASAFSLAAFSTAALAAAASARIFSAAARAAAVSFPTLSAAALAAAAF